MKSDMKVKDTNVLTTEKDKLSTGAHLQIKDIVVLLRTG